MSPATDTTPARPAYQPSEARIASDLAEQHAEMLRHLKAVADVTAITGEPNDA